MSLSPIKPLKAYEVVTDQIKKSILNGEFPPGSKLPSVRLLSAELGVSQAAVREALTSLQAMNLIVMRQGEGTFVNRYDPDELAKLVAGVPLLSQDDVMHLLELRKVIETGTTSLAARRRSDENLRDMRRILHDMESDLSSATLGEQADWEFHYEIAKASGNPYVLMLLEEVSEKIKSFLRLSRQRLYQQKGEAERLLAQHLAIFEAIAKQNEVQAEAHMLAHLTHVEAALNFDATREGEGACAEDA